MKTQLFAKNTAGQTVLIQLSDVDPVKMNLSVAGLDPFTPQSFYSQTFLVPGQGSNSQFFEDVFSVNGTTFNAGVAAEAWINTDGFLFAVGNINLQQVNVNEKYNSVEYEIFFLGDTSDFVQSVGDSYMDSINTDELNHELTQANVILSWGATAGATAGLKDGNVLYPLCEWGYNYDTANFPTNTTLSTNYPKGSTGDYGGSFTNGPTSALELTQFKPAVRVKWLFDKIFEDAGYTYDSVFIESNMFDRMYMVSDSEARPFQDIQAGLCRIQGPNLSTFVDPDVIQNMVFNNPLDNRDQAFSITGNLWQAPGAGTYSFEVSGLIFTLLDSFGYPQAAIRVYILKNGVIVKESGVIQSLAVGTTSDPFFTNSWSLTLTDTLAKDDIIQVQWQQLSYGSVQANIFNPTFVCGDAPDLVVVRSFFPPNGTLKRMDFIKGIATMFNFVFEPSKVSEKSFVIEPWIDWVTGGSRSDWTGLLDGESTIQQIPAFLERERVLDFVAEEDQDLQNEAYQQQFKRTYAYREYNSEIQVIRGTTEVKIPFGSTPLQSIPSRTDQYPDWVFPTFAKLQPGDPTQNQAGKVQPIQPKPRILFYNGLQSNPIDWYLQEIPAGLTGSAQSQYPLVSPYNVWPPQDPGQPNNPQLELSFQSKRALWSDDSSYITPVNNDLYTQYWETYTEWIYDPYNRIVRASFRLDPYDVQQLKFNDKIWVKDSWYLVREIKDYPVGEVALVDVELIKVPDLVLPSIGAPATGPFGGTCDSFAICNNNALLTDPVTYTYVSCDNTTLEITISPKTCRSVCALSPLVTALPAGFSSIKDGDCPLGVFTPIGAFIFIELAATGASFAQDTDVIVHGSTGGTGGPYTRMQYITISGTDSIETTYNVPDGYFCKIQMTNRNGGVGPFQSFGVLVYENEVLVGITGGTGAFPVNGIETFFPNAIDSDSTDYLAEATFVY